MKKLIILMVVLVFASFIAEAKKDIERIDFIHYAKNNVRPARGNSDCYKLMGVKLLSTTDYIINPANNQGLSEEFITSAIYKSAETWDDSTSYELFNIFSIDYSAKYGIRDYKNSIAFGNYPNNGVIAVTSLWLNKRLKQIVEFDQLYNTYFRWGDATVDPSVMDLQNIATHEFGHVIGLNDIYSLACSYVTMYGYSDYSETSQRTLEQPDITGLQKIYGP